MPAYTKYDARVDSLVIEARTAWDPSVGTLSDEDKAWLTQQVHKHPAQASKVTYERMHTGFSREITVTKDDIARIYREQVGA
ncbi:hypothetical protein GC163_21745 [bacterium]|nr:hypothetical protein [bacterium]